MLGNILIQNIISLWLQWQFFAAPKAILRAWGNFLKYNLNYFSLPILVKTFFSPWHRYSLSYGKGFSPKRYFEALTFNIFSRVIGAILRLFFIVSGLLIEVVIFFSGLVIFLVWLAFPAILITGFLYGAQLLF